MNLDTKYSAIIEVVKWQCNRD